MLHDHLSLQPVTTAGDVRHIRAVCHQNMHVEQQPPQHNQNNATGRNDDIHT